MFGTFLFSAPESKEMKKILFDTQYKIILITLHILISNLEIYVSNVVMQKFFLGIFFHVIELNYLQQLVSCL